MIKNLQDLLKNSQDVFNAIGSTIALSDEPIVSLAMNDSIDDYMEYMLKPKVKKHGRHYNVRQVKASTLAGLDIETVQKYRDQDGNWRTHTILLAFAIRTKTGMTKLHFKVDGEYSYDIDPWLQFMDYIFANDIKETQCFIHNLGFEMSYLLDYLERYQDFLKDRYKDKKDFLFEGKINYKACDTGQAFIYLNLFDRITFKDSMLLYTNMPLKKVGDICGVNKIDHNPIYQNGHINTDEDIEYCMQDACIPIYGVEYYIKTINENIVDLEFVDKEPFQIGLSHLFTGASVAYQIWKHTWDEGLLQFKDEALQWLADKYENPNVLNKTDIYEIRYTIKKYLQEVLMAPLEQEVWDILYPAYMGGYNLAKPGLYSNCNKYDLENCYPSRMVKCNYPIGKPKITKVIPKDAKHYIVHMTEVEYKCKPGYPKFVPHDKDELSLCEIDFERFKNTYDYKHKLFSKPNVYTNVVSFDRTIYGEDLFGEFIYGFRRLMSALKSKAANGDIEAANMRTILKTVFNGLYGKFGTNIYSKEFDWEIGNDDLLKRSKIDEGYNHQRNRFYLPLAIYVTAHGRVSLLEPLKTISWDKVVYCDTDSMTLIDGTEMPAELCGGFGKFDCEGHNLNIRVVDKKVYQVEDPTGKKSFEFRAKGIRKSSKDIRTGKVLSTITSLAEFDGLNEVETLQFKKIIGGKAAHIIRKKVKR